MNQFDLKDIQPYLFLIVGLFVFLYSLFKKSKSKNLLDNGIKTEGIIFEVVKKSGLSFGNSSSFLSNVNDDITVRFTTRKLEWITAKVKTDFAFFYTGQYKPGDKVEIMYNPDTPNDFILLTKQSETISRIAIATIGLIFLVIGIYNLLKK